MTERRHPTSSAARAQSRRATAASRRGKSPSAAKAWRISTGPAPSRSAASNAPANAITSLSPEQADTDALLALWRDHWLIENRLHWRRDVILREDHSLIRSGTTPRTMAALRNALLNIVRDAAEPLSEIREIFAEDKIKAIAVAHRGVL